jgi:thiol-disulfide isomerase/thioredoxin
MRVISLFIVLVLLAACGGQSAPPAAAPASTEEPTPTAESSGAGMEPNQSIARTLTFYNSWAAWCGTCRSNEPVLQNLAEQFGAEIIFTRLDVDNPADTATREQFGLFDRSQYILVDEKGEVVQRWFGQLREDDVASAISAYLSSRSS